MEYTCIYCRKPFNINPAEAASAVIDYTFGRKTHNFKCDNCGKDNALTKAQYEAARIAAETPKPVAKPASQPSPLMAPAGGIKPVAAPAPKPVAPAPVAPPMTRREATKKTKEDNARRRGEDVSKGSKVSKASKISKISRISKTSKVSRKGKTGKK